MNNRLILTKYQDKYLTLLMGEHRLLAAAASENQTSRIDAIYIGKVKKVAKNINACFVEIQKGELCFLAMSDAKRPFLLNRVYDGRILEGDELPVQVIREAIKTKLAAVSAKLSLAGELVAVYIDEPQVHLSAKLNKQQKEELRKLLKQENVVSEKGMLAVEEGFPPIGMVVRTRAYGTEDNTAFVKEFLQLKKQLMDILEAAKYRTCHTCLKEPEISYEAHMEQIYPEEYTEVVTDLEEHYESLKSYIHSKRNQPQIPVRLYQDKEYPLYKLYRLETLLKEALSPRVWLKSGGYLIIEPTEALTVIDVNSGKYSAQVSPQEMAYRTNMEAAEEIALQLRLRNLSGIIIIDFINMQNTGQTEELIQLMKASVRTDRVQTNVIDITPLGLVEITRKKRYKSLQEQFISNKQ